MEHDPKLILVVEDEAEIRELISLHLLRQGFLVQESQSGEDALSKLKVKRYDLIILDWMLPGKSGVELVQDMRSLEVLKLNQLTPVLMLTAKTESEDIVKGLDAGADDYLLKPFDIQVLMARIKALLRRPLAHKEEMLKTLEFGKLKLNIETYEVYCGNEPLHLTPSEFKLLVFMSQNQGVVMTRERLVEHIQGQGVNVVGRTIDTHVFGLRKKLGACADFIETIRGIGYRIKMQA